MSLSRRTSLVLEDEPLTTIQKTRNFMTSSQLYSTSWSKPPSSLMWLIAVTASRSYFLPTTQKPVKTKSDHAATLLQTLQWLPSKAELKPEALQTLTPVTCYLPDLLCHSPWPIQVSHTGFLTIPLNVQPASDSRPLLSIPSVWKSFPQLFAWLLPSLPSGLCSKAILSMWLSLTILYKQQHLPPQAGIPYTP